MTSDVPLYERDPEAWTAHLAEGNAEQARKRVGVDVVLRDEQGRILLVDPEYKPDWDLPGGMAEANEPPHQAVRRELKEELDLDLDLDLGGMGLLCVDWVSRHGPWDDSLMFVFDGGTLTEQQVSHLHITDDELVEFRFCTPEEASRLLRPYVWRRVEAALEALSTGHARYLRDGYQS